MVDTYRTKAELIALCPDNSANQITEQVLRDIITSTPIGPPAHAITIGGEGSGIGGGENADAAFAAAIAAVPAGGTIYVYDGQYVLTSLVEITTANVSLIGESISGTNIVFAPTADGTCIKFSLSQTLGMIKNFNFTSTDSTYAKVALEIEDASGMSVSDIRVGSGGSNFWSNATADADPTTGDCIGILTKGREDSYYRRIRIFADNPVVMAPNPNLAFYDGDHFHWEDTYLVCTTGVESANFKILPGTRVSNMTIDGVNSWGKGKYGFLWETTTTTTSSQALSISNIRHEQGINTGGELIRISHGTAKIQNLQINNISGDLNLTNGIYVKGATELALSNLAINTPGVALEIENNTPGELQYLEWNNCLWGQDAAATVVIPPELVLRSGTANQLSTSAAPMKAVYTIRNAGAVNHSQDEGVYVSEGVHHYNRKHTLIAPQTSVSDLSIDVSENTITSGGTVDFTGILKGDSVYLAGTANGNDKWYVVAQDGTATTLVTTTAFGGTDETDTNGVVVTHGTEIPGGRGNCTNLAKTEVLGFLPDRASAQAQAVVSLCGKTGTVVDMNVTNSAVFDGFVVGSSAAPNADICGLTQQTVPHRLYNNGTTDPSPFHVIITATWD